jgi:hypothetical protein
MQVGEKKKHCGPQGDSVFAKSLTELIPDVIFGVDLGCACEKHDLNWEKYGANKGGDLDLKRRVRTQFRKAGKPRILGLMVSHWYYIGVRLGGIVYKLEGK